MPRGAAKRWVPLEPNDYLWRPVSNATLGPWSSDDWRAAVARLPAAGAAALAGLMYMQVNAWAPWAELLAHAAHANRAGVTVYFLGPRLPFELRSVCPACGWLPLDQPLVLRRLRTLGWQLNPGRKPGPRKLCDLKPLWPAMFPELSARHAWIGYADSDILFGDLASEVARLRPEDELLVPASFYPQPLSNGNFLLMRATAKMMRAYERSENLQSMLHAFRYQGFDEWGLSRRGSMMSVYQDMLLSGQLGVRPTSRLLVQDAVIVNGATFPTVDSYGANVSFEWRGGKLLAERDGVCVCPDDTVPQFGLTVCDQCLAKRGMVLANVRTHRRVEVMGFHFQEWKKRWRRAEYRLLAAHAGSRTSGSLAASAEPPPFAAPSCPAADVASSGFHVLAEGFRCGRIAFGAARRGGGGSAGPRAAKAAAKAAAKRARAAGALGWSGGRDWPTGNAHDCPQRLAPQLYGCPSRKAAAANGRLPGP